MDTVLSHFAKQNEIKQCPFKIKFGGASRQMKSQGLFTQPLKKSIAAYSGRMKFLQEKYSLVVEAANNYFE